MHIQIDIDKTYTSLDMLVARTVSLLLLAPSTLSAILENIKRGIVQHP